MKPDLPRIAILAAAYAGQRQRMYQLNDESRQPIIGPLSHALTVLEKHDLAIIRAQLEWELAVYRFLNRVERL